jgi:DNA polymerase-3 subunit chi
MTEVLFYHLERQPLERVLPQLLRKTLERGWRAVVRAGSDERAEAISAQLWTHDDASFIPHGTKLDGSPARQPIWLTAGPDRPNDAEVLFLVDGAEPDDIEGLQRAVFLFNGRDGEAVERARETWKSAKAAGHDVSYWQQDDAGRWVNRAGDVSLRQKDHLGG